MSKRKHSSNKGRKADRDRSGRKQGRKAERPELRIEPLEQRILLSATWQDADTGDPIPGPTEGDDVFLGSDGDDTADALGGDDQLFGGAGDDVLAGGAGDDVLEGGTGTDTADYGGAAGGVTVDLNQDGVAQNTGGDGTDTLTGIENITGSDFDDTLTGDAGDNTLAGGAGDDTLAGGEGDDVLDGGTGTDTADYSTAAAGVTVDLTQDGVAQDTGGDGTDTLTGVENITGSDFDDTLTGDAGDNTLSGGAGDDVLDGGDGDDVLDGGTGSDTLTGGAGDDTFQFAGAQDGDLLTIDGGTGNDTIDLSGFNSNAASYDNGEIVIDLGGGDSFTIQHTNVNSIQFGDKTVNFVTWDGEAPSDDWSDQDNWSSDAIPGADDIVVFDGTSGDDAVIDGGFGAAVGGVLVTADYAGTITLSGNLTVDGDVVLDNGTLDVGDNDLHVAGNLKLDGGDVAVGAGDTTIDGTLDIDGGSFTQTGGSITLAGDLTHAAGAVDVTGASVEFQTSGATLETGSITFGDVTFDASGAVTLTGDMDIDGDLTIQSLTNLSGGDIYVAGDLSALDGDCAGDAMFVVDGAGDQTIDAGGGTGELLDLIIDKSGGTLSLEDTIRVNGDLTHVAGAVDAGTSTVEFTGSGTLQTGSISFRDVVFDTAGVITISGDMDVSDDLTIRSLGTLNGDDLLVADDITTETAAFGGTATIVADGGGGQTLSASGGTGALNHFRIDKSGGTLTVNDTIQINGDLTHANGTVDWSSSTAEFVGTSTLQTGSMSFRDVVFDTAGVITISGDMDVSDDLTIRNLGTLDGDDLLVTDNITTETAAFGGTATIVADGGGGQTLSASGGTGALNHFRIDKSGGTLTIDDTIQIGGDLTHVAGTVATNGSTVEFQGSSTLEVDSITFDNLVLNAGDVTITADLDVDGDLTIQALTSLNGGDVYVAGDVTTVDAGFTAAPTIVIDGAGPQTIDASGGTGSLHHLTIDKTGGTLTLQDTIEISGDLTHTSGTIDATAADVVFQGTGSTIDTGSISFGDVTIDSSGTVTATGAIDVDGYLIVTNGAVDVGDNDITATADIRVNGGSLTIGTGAVTVGGDLRFDGGDFTHSSGTITVADDLTHTGGAVDVAGVTVEFTGASANLQSGSITFGDVVIDSTGTVTINGDMDVDGVMTIQALATLNGDNLRADGDVTSLDSAINGTGTILFDGTGDQTLDAAGGTAGVPNLAVDKAGGTLTVADDLAINGSFTHVAGAVDVSAVQVEFQGTGTLTTGTVTFSDVVLNAADLTISGDMDVNGDLTIQALANIGGDDILASGDVTTLDAAIGGTGGFVIDGAGAQAIDAGGGAGAIRNLTIDKAGGTLTVSEDLIVSGDLTHTAGAVDVSAVEIEFQDSGTLQSGSITFNDVALDGATLTISGDMDVDGALTIQALGTLNGDDVLVSGDITTLDSSYGGTGTIVADGVGDQTLDASGGNGELHHFTIDKAGGTLTLQDTIEISGDLTHVAGAVDASAATVEIQGSGTLTTGTITFGDLTLNADDVTISGDMDVDGTLTVQSLTSLAGDDVLASGNITTVDVDYVCSSTIVADGGSDQTLGAGGGTAGLYNLTVHKSGGTLTVADDLVISGDLTRVAGTVDVSAVEVEFRNSGTHETGTITFSDVTFDAVTLTVIGDMLIDNDLTIQALTTLDDGNVRVSGDVYFYDPIFDGTGEIVIAGGGHQTFYTFGVALPPQVLDKPFGDLFVIDTVSTVEDVALTVDNILVNLVNINDDPFVIDSITQPAHGVVVDNGDGTLTYTPDAHWGDADSFVYMVKDPLNEVAQITVNIGSTAIADAPTLTVSDATGNEDTAIALDISAALIDVDGSETLSDVTITGVPDGATLSAGVNNGGGNWTVAVADLADLTITPPGDSDVDFTLGVSVTSTEASNADTATSVASIDVTVNAVADAPTLTVDDASGDEDTAIALDIATALVDVDGSESLSDVTITNVPAGATFSAGTDNGDGSWTVAVADLGGLTITPPANSDVDFTLGVSVTSTEAANADSATTVANIDVTVDAVIDAPTLTVDDATGNEDSAIALDISAALVDVDGSESLSDVTITNVPAGATLSAGTDNGDGSWTVAVADLGGLTITPPTNSDADFTLGVSVTSTEAATAESATTVGSIDVTVDAVADAPTLTVDDASGDEDTAIALDISTALVDVDGSESLSDVTITSVPAGATLSAGTDNGDGSWTIAVADLGGLTITPPAHSDADFTLGVSVTSTESSNADEATSVATIDVTVIAVADAPTLTVDDASGDEDTAIALDISTALVDVDGSESLSDVTITNVPAGATFSAGTDNGDGSWTVAVADLGALTITPPAHSDTDFTLGVSVTSTESANADTATSVATIDVTVEAVVDAPTLTVEDASGDEDSAIALDISTALVDVDGSESLSDVTITNVPAGATLSAGTDNGDGSWTVAVADLGGLTITPPADSDADFTLGVSVTSTEAATAESATSVGSIDVTVDAVADAPTLTVDNATGNEDSAIALDISTALVDVDGTESLSDVTITNVPAGASLSAGTDNGDGSWTVAVADLGGLTITPPAHSDADFTLGVSVTSTESANADTATSVANIDVTVDAVVDAPTLTVDDAAGNEDTAIPLDITAALVDVDGSESLSDVTITDVPAGASLSAGTDNGDGSWTVAVADLGGLTITPPTNSDADFTLGVSVTSTESSNADAATSVGSIDVTVNAVADAPTLTVEDASGDEDSAIALDITAALVDVDGSESLSDVTITNVPAGATLSAGTDNGDGSWTVAVADLGGLTITPPADSDADFTLGVSVTSTESSNADAATSVGSIDVTVDAVADAPTLTVDDAAGNEDSAIALDISTALVDVDGTESLSDVTITNVPAGASLSAGTDNGDGSWTVAVADLGALTITPPAHSDADFTLGVSVTSTESANADTATSVANIDVTVDAVVDAPTLTVDDAAGNEDTAIPLDITAALVDVDGSESLSDVTITDVPAGASLSAGVDNGDGSWTVAVADLGGLTITPPTNSDADFTLGVSVTSTEAATAESATSVGSIDVTVDAVADAPTLTVDDAAGNEDSAIALDISTALVDVDGSESLSDVTITNVPAGASLSAGTDNGDGSWTVAVADLGGLTITPPAHSDADFTLGVSVTSTEAENADTTNSVANIDVTVDAVADAPTLTVDDAAGEQDIAIPLDITAALVDVDGSESLSDVTISGVPSGATLSAGIDNGDGSWTVAVADLSGLTITPPAGSDADFTLGVSVTSTESSNADAATSVASIDVTVAGVADAPTLTVDDAAGDEDSAIALDISAALVDVDGSESLSDVTITNVPAGASLSAGTDNGDGSWTIAVADLGGLTITPPADSDADFTLGVSVTSTESSNDDSATSVASIEVMVSGIADAPTLAVQGGSGTAYDEIPLEITVSLVDVDGSESLTDVTITNVPAGATLSAGTDNGDGSWTVAVSDLDGLTITPPVEYVGDLTLGVSITSIEADGGDSTTVSAQLLVPVDPVPLNLSDGTSVDDAELAEERVESEAEVAEQDPVVANVFAGWDGTEELEILDPEREAEPLMDIGDAVSAVDHVLSELDEEADDLTLDLFEEVNEDRENTRIGSGIYGATDAFTEAFEMIGEITETADSAASDGEAAELDSEASRTFAAEQLPSDDPSARSDPAAKSAAWFWAAMRAALGVRRPSE